MRTKNFWKHLFLGVLLLSTGKMVGQVSTASNVAAGPNDFLGWDNTFPTNDFPLRIRHDLNQPIQWFTDSIQRMQLWRTQSSAINGFSGIRQNGFLGISPQPQFYSSTVGPFSRLHLTDSISDDPVNYAQQYGYRPWMRNPSAGSGLAPSS